MYRRPAMREMKRPAVPSRGTNTAGHRTGRSDEAVDQVLEHFLTTRVRLRIDVRRDGRVGNRLEARALRVDLLPRVALPLRVSLRHELVDTAILDQRGRREQRAREQVQATHVTVEHVGR